MIINTNHYNYYNNIRKNNVSRIDTNLAFSGKEVKPDEQANNNSTMKKAAVVAFAGSGILAAIFGIRKLSKSGETQKVVKESVFEQLKKFPELLANRDEMRAINERNELKKAKGQFDIDYYKGEFRTWVTIAAENLRILRESPKSEIKPLFETCRNQFQINEGIMIHGTNRTEKKELLEHFTSEAKKHGMEVVHIPAGDSDPAKFNQAICEQFPKAKEKFNRDKVMTMFVIEDVDKMIAKEIGPARGSINRHVQKAGEEGVMWVSTVSDLSKIDDSCYRGGRVKDVIDIDKASELSKKPQE